MSGRRSSQTQVLPAPRPTLVKLASEVEVQLDFLVQMPTCSEAGELESSKTQPAGHPFRGPTAPSTLSAVQLGVAGHQRPWFPSPGPEATTPTWTAY